MLDKKFLLNNRNTYEENMKNRNMLSEYDLFLDLNNKYVEAKKKYDNLKSEQKKIKKFDDFSKKIKNELIEVSKLLSYNEKKLSEWLLNQPNILLNEVPIGKNENENKIVYETEKPEELESIPHYEMLNNLILESEASELSGSRHLILKQRLSNLKRGLIDFMLENNKNNDYDIYDVPYIVNEHAFYKAGQFPKFKDEAFELTNGQWLISTGEVALVSMFANKIFKADELPKLCTTYSPCFRKEAGSAGKDTKGMIRLHQFHKIELVSFCKPEDSEKYHEKQRQTAENILKAIHLPYRVVTLCSGDTGFTSCKTYDIEVWLPGSKRYLEIASCSQCGDFQARRANIKYLNGDKLEYVHTLNGSSLPLERLMIGILENYYDKETHSIIIPQILRDYCKKNQIIL